MISTGSMFEAFFAGRYPAANVVTNPKKNDRI
jgi:hypothetical protein